MKQYYVKWESEFDAEGPSHAAIAARKFLLDPGSPSNPFYVRQVDSVFAKPHLIDVSEIDEVSREDLLPDSVKKLIESASELLENLLDSGANGPHKDDEYESPYYDINGDRWYPDVARMAIAIDVLRGVKPRCFIQEDDPRYSREEWRRQVANDETISGYREWRTHQFIEQQESEDE